MIDHTPETAIAESLRGLQSDLANADLDAAFAEMNAAGMHPYMVRNIDGLKLKMYQERGHALPHVHVDFRHAHHVASYAISPIRVLEGNLPKTHDKLVRSWLAKNQQTLLAVWSRMQAGQPFEVALAAIDCSAAGDGDLGDAFDAFDPT